MASILIQLPTPPGTDPRLLELDAGQTATFGRGDPHHPVDAPLPHPGVSRLAGELTAAGDHWLISNFSPDRTYVVDNPEGGGEHLKIAPRRLGAPVPFEFARVAIPVDGGMVTFLVYAPEHTYADVTRPSPDGDPTMAAFRLDETAKYFLVLVALCEPRLRDGSCVTVPLVPEVVERLAGLGPDHRLTRSAVGFHIDYLAEHKLRVRRLAGSGDERLEGRRAALVAVALRFNLVREEHLALLSPRHAVAR